MNAISPIRSSICLRSRGATKKGLITSTGECGTDSSAGFVDAPSAPIGRGQRREAKVRLTLRWRKPDSNLWSHLQRGQPYHLTPSFFCPAAPAATVFISENDHFELPASRRNLFLEPREETWMES